LTTIRNATRILVFQQGRIVETGSYDELVRAGGLFAKFVEAQFDFSPLPAARAARAEVEQA
ncbi:MAG: hypothetical protein ACREH9_10065, partial [Pseudomonadota bacterium]